MTTFYCSLFSTSGMLSYEWKIYITSHYPQGTRSIIKEGTGRFQDVEVWVDRTKQHLLVLIGMLYHACTAAMAACANPSRDQASQFSIMEGKGRSYEQAITPESGQPLAGHACSSMAPCPGACMKVQTELSGLFHDRCKVLQRSTVGHKAENKWLWAMESQLTPTVQPYI